MSHALIKEFRSLHRILSESNEAVERVIGRDSKVTALLKAAQNAIVVSLMSDIQHQVICSTDQRLIDYLVFSMGSQSVEQLKILFLDRANRLIAEEIMAKGSLTSITAYPRNLFKRAFEHSASAMLIVHNHPGGSIEPSRCDISFTRELVALGRPLEIDIRDHIIIAGTKWVSFLRQGLL